MSSHHITFNYQFLRRDQKILRDTKNTADHVDQHEPKLAPINQAIYYLHTTSTAIMSTNDNNAYAAAPANATGTTDSANMEIVHVFLQLTKLVDFDALLQTVSTEQELRATVDQWILDSTTSHP